MAVPLPMVDMVAAVPLPPPVGTAAVDMVAVVGTVAVAVGTVAVAVGTAAVVGRCKLYKMVESALPGSTLETAARMKTPGFPKRLISTVSLHPYTVAAVDMVAVVGTTAVAVAAVAVPVRMIWLGPVRRARAGARARARGRMDTAVRIAEVQTHNTHTHILFFHTRLVPLTHSLTLRGAWDSSRCCPGGAEVVRQGLDVLWVLMCFVSRVPH